MSGPRNVYITALQRERDELRRTIHGLSEVLETVKADRDEELERSDNLRRERDNTRAQLQRVIALLCAVDDLALAFGAMLTYEQIDSPEYPNDLDERMTELAQICRDYGDLPEGAQVIATMDEIISQRLTTN